MRLAEHRGRRPALLESAPWKCVEEPPAMAFTLETTTAVRVRGDARPLSIATVEGRAVSLTDDRLRIVDGDDVALRFALPDCVEVARLVGRRVRVTLQSDTVGEGPREQLLTVTDAEGRTILVAYLGPGRGNAHMLGGMRVYAALSQRPGGPIVFGTSGLQCLVHVGEQVAICDAAADYVMHFIARTAHGDAAYVIVDRTLWRRDA